MENHPTRLDKAVKISIITAVLISALSIVYYLVIFIPKRTQAQLDQQKQEQQWQDNQKTINGASSNIANTESNDVAFSNWQLVTSPDGMFSVKLPKGWRDNTITGQDPDIDMLGYSSNVDDGKITYMIQRADYSKVFKKNKIALIDEKTSKKLLQVFLSGTVETSEDDKVTNSQFVNFKGYTALRFTVSNLKDGTMSRGLVLINDKTLYILAGQSHVSGMSDLENFINSFSLNK